MKRYCIKLALFVLGSCQFNVHAANPMATETNKDVITDSIGMIVLKAPPASTVGREIDQEPGFVSIVDDFGNLVRVELAAIPPDIYATSREKGGDKGLLRFLFDTQYFPKVLANMPSLSEEKRAFINSSDKEIFIVGYNFPKGSVHIEDGKPLDAKRYVASYIDNPYCVYMSIELNTVTADLSSTNLFETAKGKILQVFNSVSIVKEAKDKWDAQAP